MIPRYVLSQEIEVERNRGHTAYGPAYAYIGKYRAAVDLTMHRTVNAKGEAVASLGEVLTNPDADVQVGDRITCLGLQYVAQTVNPIRLGLRDHHKEITLGRLPDA